MLMNYLVVEITQVTVSQYYDMSMVVPRYSDPALFHFLAPFLTKRRGKNTPDVMGGNCAFTFTLPFPSRGPVAVSPLKIRGAWQNKGIKIDFPPPFRFFDPVRQ
ncbi:hypothetical protein ElyMa_006057900 [Elysia marginata]|uniref:Uncharacterized protein n=1 Tax=Elysia marginata TaxID=1093978 RepID=A0AAV4GNY1_9GAST|nr:hypothetical protein ElyMa_006057900 [Elysia marginata]